MDIYNKIDFEKYNTFFLEYYKDNNIYNRHIIRPCTASYNEITNINRTRTYILEGAVMSFDHNTSLSEILVDCAIVGVTIDFIDILIPSNKYQSYGDEHKIVQIIDTHKDDINKYVDKIEAKRYYISLNTNKRDKLKYLVVDRFLQDNSIEFLQGKYDKKAIISGFKEHEEALRYCNDKNN